MSGSVISNSHQQQLSLEILRRNGNDGNVSLFSWARRHEKLFLFGEQNEVFNFVTITDWLWSTATVVRFERGDFNGRKLGLSFSRIKGSKLGLQRFGCWVMMTQSVDEGTASTKFSHFEFKWQMGAIFNSWTNFLQNCWTKFKVRSIVFILGSLNGCSGWIPMIWSSSSLCSPVPVKF